LIYYQLDRQAGTIRPDSEIGEKESRSKFPPLIPPPPNKHAV